MRFIEAEDNEENQLYHRLVSEDGKIEMGIYPVVFGYRVRAGYTDAMSFELDWCGGDQQEQLELLYSIMKNILESKGDFSGIPMHSDIKPFYKDNRFVNLITSMVVQPLETIKLKPLNEYRIKMMKSL